MSKTKMQILFEVEKLFKEVISSLGWANPKQPFGVKVSLENDDSDEPVLSVADFNITVDECSKLKLIKVAVIVGYNAIPNGDVCYPDLEEHVYIDTFCEGYKLVRAVVLMIAEDYINLILEDCHINQMMEEHRYDDCF